MELIQQTQVNAFARISIRALTTNALSTVSEYPIVRTLLLLQEIACASQAIPGIHYLRHVFLVLQKENQLGLELELELVYFA